MHEASTMAENIQNNVSRSLESSIGVGAVIAIVLISVGFLIRKRKISKRKEERNNEEGTYINIFFKCINNSFLLNFVIKYSNFKR